MSNPFDKHREEPRPAQDLHAWCEEQNAKKITFRMSRWYFVAKADGVDRIDCLEGTDGENVHKLLAGKLQDFAGWPAARMDGYRNWLRSVADNGRVDHRQLEPA
jgi:hypothetical protein